jgi:thioredoxin-like negative regulator of GroEL
MKPFPLLLLIISAFLQVTSSASEGQTAPSSSNDTPSSDIVKLTSRNFESEISDGSIWLIEFYTDWCG